MLLIRLRVVDKRNMDDSCDLNPEGCAAALALGLHSEHVPFRYPPECRLWDVSPCGSSKNQRLGGTYFLLNQVDKNRRARNNVSSN
jgi:hypothetical protein